MSKAKHLNMTTPKKKLDRSWRNPIELFIQLLTPKYRGEPKKDVTPFVKRMREIAALSKPVQLWDSSRLGTYRRGKNNAL